jgi:DNA-binding NtrC family response regulator
MTTQALAVPEPVALTSRHRDRRNTWGDLLGRLTRALAESSDPTVLRSAFEAAVCHALPLEGVELRDRQFRFTRRSQTDAAPESIALDVPAPGGGGVLEAALRPGAPIGEWDLQTLGAAAHLGALVLEIERGRLHQVRLSRAQRPVRDGAAPLIGRTPAVQALRTQIERVASTDFTVLLEGESGVGKELVAHQIHDLSRRRHGPFVAINCAALVETLVEAELFGIEERTATGVRGRRGKFEHADGGTLFLDEVSDLSMAAQAKLLRVIQDLAIERVGGKGPRTVDIRIVAATNRPLKGLVDRQLFRADLYFRLTGVDIRVPPLRERREDVLELATYFLDRHRTTRSLRLSVAAGDALMAYDWPGNVRELERLMERAVALAGSEVIELDDLPATVRGDASAMAVSAARADSMRAWGGRYARLVLDRVGGRKREACRWLGISYHTLNAYLREPVDQPGPPPPADAWDDRETEAEGERGVCPPDVQAGLCGTDLQPGVCRPNLQPGGCRPDLQIGRT